MQGAAGAGPVDDVDVARAWQRLESDPHAQLIDVRTRAEWMLVGYPELGGIGKAPIFIEWRVLPGGRPDEAFLRRLEAELAIRRVPKTADLYFLCRSGVRSRLAAEAMVRLGYGACHNIGEGFEGELDENRRRGTRAGWKVSDLPWAQQ